MRDPRRRGALAATLALAATAGILTCAAPAQATPVAAPPTLSFVAGTGSAVAPSAGPATSSALSYPQGVAVDGAGNVYIADTSNHRIEKVDTFGQLSIIAGTGTAGAPTAGPATSSALYTPSGVAVDSAGNVYIADTSNHRIEKVNTSGQLSIIAGTGTAGAPTAGAATSSTLSYPAGVAVDGAGNVYIADTNSYRIEKVNPSGQLSIIAGTGRQGAPTAGAATSSTLNQPYGVGVDGAGNVYIADTFNHRIEKVDTSGQLSVIAGAGTTGAATAGAATSSALSYPQGVAVDGAGNVYIADTGNNRIEKVTFPVGMLPTISTPTMSQAPVVGTAYTFGATGSAGGSTITWSISAGSLPAGLALNTATGAITGTPTTAGTSTFTLMATTTAGYDTLPATLTVNPAPAVVASLPQQQLTSSAPKSLSLGARTFALNATATGSTPSSTGSSTAGGKLNYTAATPQICTVDSSGIVTALKAGTCTVTVTAAATTTNGLTAKNLDITITAPEASVAALPTGPQRFAGSERVATSADIAAKVFPTPAAGTSRDVVIATAGSYADALAGSRLAGQVGGPLLLTNGNQLSEEAAAQVKRLVAAGGTVYLLGGDKALSDAVEKATGDLVSGDTVVRVGGDTRFETAAAIADATVKKAGDVGPIYLVTGKDFADGVSVGAYAQSTGGVVLLTDGEKMPAATAAYLKDHDPTGTRAVAIGGPAKTAATTAGLDGAASRAVVGADRYETSAKLAAAMKASASSSSSSSTSSVVASVGLAGGASWSDALSGSAAMAALGGPLLLTPTGSDSVPPSTATALSALRAQRVLAFGGTSAIPAAAYDRAGALLNS
nr:cell wall-binding repeat-containing protein [Quadrisphaera sp. RL12-1S]